MTRSEIIASVDITRPNLVSEETKLHWLEVLEKQIHSHMTQFGESDAAIGEQTLLLPQEYKDMYVYYVVSMIDLTNQDIAMYNNSCAFFNQMLLSWQKEWRRKHLPKKDTRGGA